MKSRQFSRRDFFYLFAGGAVVAAGYPLARAISQSKGAMTGQQALRPTPGNTLGPYYKSGAPRRERLAERGDEGVPLLVSGRVLNTEGRALSGSKVEVFHADHSGVYDLDGFRYRGEVPVGAGGEYRLETIVPGHYGGRARHVHYVITAPGHRQLVTQLYFENDPIFDGDPDRNYSRDNLVQHRELIRPVAISASGGINHAAVIFDICLEKA